MQDVVDKKSIKTQKFTQGKGSVPEWVCCCETTSACQQEFCCSWSEWKHFNQIIMLIRTWTLIQRCAYKRDHRSRLPAPHTVWKCNASHLKSNTRTNSFVHSNGHLDAGCLLCLIPTNYPLNSVIRNLASVWPPQTLAKSEHLFKLQSSYSAQKGQNNEGK